MVDWDLAVTTATRLVRPGPMVSREEARAAVSDLRRYADQAQRHVQDYTGLVASASDGSAVAVIDRPGWIQANAAGFRTVLEPLVEKLSTRRGATSGTANAVGSRVTGVQTGSLLAFLATKVLGQYELFPPYGADPAATPGRLLLVAPNIVSAEREMAVDPRDFRLWVCLHEETHRVQFGAVPWLRGHVMDEVRAFVDATDVDPAAMARRLRAAAIAAYDALRGQGGEDGTSFVEAVQTPAQREVLDRITALMSLLEGHADYVMDGVGPEVIPSVAEIRRTFQHRREDAPWFEQVVRRLLGIDAKLRQYRDGERFVRGVVERAGMAGFNKVWERKENLPTRAELAEPQVWVTRVVG
ncbi:MAG TPA: zinc-dependent metalloprotease [Candidatus Eisenbacteria bacterium]|nr:zinc-dependent metalloprotease [Candidatus Eisenbacteria bacterium]